MGEARELIALFHEMNGSENGGAGDRCIARFTPALVGMIGTTRMFDALLSQLDGALASGKISDELRRRARNLAETFVPQVAALNGFSGLTADEGTAEALRGISCNTPHARKEGVKVILSALLRVLKEALALP